jgi:hypothetical protein
MWLMNELWAGFVGVKKSDERGDNGTDTEPNPFLPFRKVRGKPSLSQDYLFSRRENLVSLIEPHWHELERNLRCAKKLEQISLVFNAIEGFRLNPGPLAPLLRANSEPATKSHLEATRKRLADANRNVYSASDKHEAQRRSWEEARRISSSLSEESAKHLRAELKSRRESIRKFKDWCAKVQCKIWEVEHKTGITVTVARLALAALERCMGRLEHDRAADEKVCSDLEARLRTITPSARKFATEETTRRKARLDSFEAQSTNAVSEQQTIQAQFLDQEAFFYRKQLLDFVLKGEYTLTPLQLANGIAGLPYITSRRSAERCSPMKSKVPKSTAYELFEFVTDVWKQYRDRGKAKFSLIDAFESAIRKRPKFTIVEGHRRPSLFRSYLAKNWYYLKRALQESEVAKVHPSAVPGTIVKHFFRQIDKPDSPNTPMVAERERIID